MKNAYQILGVTPSTSTAQVKGAYWKLSQKWHPDKNKSPEAQQMFAEISEAYNVLSDPAKRADLDSKISTGFIVDINEVVERVVDSYLDTLCKT